MVTENREALMTEENRTRSLSVVELIKQAEGQREKQKKPHKQKNGAPYWQPIKGIIRWEKRQMYRDSQGKRKMRVLETRKTKPRGIK